VIRRQHYPDGASGGGPLVVLTLTGDDRPAAIRNDRVFTECWVTLPNAQLTDGAVDEHLSSHHHRSITARLQNEVLRAFDWCNAQAARAVGR
jgi:hypothetical protein